MKQIILLICTLSLAGCMTYNLQTYSKIDPNKKTVTVSPGSSGLNGKLKEALKNDGWALVIRRGPRVTEGRLGEQTRIEQYDTFNTRYELMVQSNQYDICIGNFTPALFYDISMVDNQSGAEVFTLGGRGCESEVVAKFTEALKDPK